jgi:transketolase
MQKIEDLKQLEKKAYEMRLEVIKMLETAGSGHVGGALGMADIFTYLYFNFLNHKPNEPNWPERDYFLLSNGHICPIWYAVLAHTGYFGKKDLQTLRKLDSHLQGHPSNVHTPGVFNSSGLLGHGQAQSIGVALGLRLDNKPNRVYCMMSDAEKQEGAVWESALIANKYKLNNLTFILDMNGIQIDGYTKDIMPMPNLAKIYEEMNWKVAQIDAHNYMQIQEAFNLTAPTNSNQPNLIIAYSIAGKGVPFMENQFAWHDWIATPEQAAQAKQILEDKLAKF